MKSHRYPKDGFTLLELLAAMAILAVMVGMLFAAFSEASRAWLLSEERVETFSQARAALDYMTKDLSQAIVTRNGPLGSLQQGLQFLGNNNSLAFIAPVNDPAGSVDLMEVVYRLSYKVDLKDPTFTETSGFLPVKLVRRVSTANSAALSCENYSASGQPNSGASCNGAEWDFYTSPDWPETSDFNSTAVLAENVVSLNFTFVSTNNDQYSYWNSTENRGIPAGAPGSYPPWSHEITVSPAGIGYNSPDIDNLPGSAGAQFMTNRAPAGVLIKIGVIDSRSAIKLKTVAGPGPAFPGIGTPPWVAITNQAIKYFSTFVPIPNGQP